MDNFRHDGMASPGRPGKKNKKGGRKFRNREAPKTDSLREQPIAESSETVKCPICGHPVDPKRMHPHMVRFHGAAAKSKGA
jgi:hypothetical protein